MSTDRSTHASRDRSAGDGSRPRVLLLGGCHVEGLGRELQSDFPCVQLWRRPTIALMSPPPTAIGGLGFDNRQSRYILRDCAKSHLPELQATACDILVFEIVRDVRSPLIRSGHVYLFDPNRMYNFVPDAPPASEAVVDLRTLLGGAVAAPFQALDPGFFEVWCEHFDRFRAAVIQPFVASGRTVILQEVFLAKQTLPPSDLFREEWTYCDAANALLRRMYAHVAGYPEVIRIGVDEALCRTASGVPGGGVAITHLLPELFALMADQVRAVAAPGREMVAKSTFARLMQRSGSTYKQVAALEAERHAQNLEILRLREQLDYQAAHHAWQMRRIERRRLRNRIGRLLRRLSTFFARGMPARRG